MDPEERRILARLDAWWGTASAGEYDGPKVCPRTGVSRTVESDEQDGPPPLTPIARRRR